jgi:hypothetical protein
VTRRLLLRSLVLAGLLLACFAHLIWNGCHAREVVGGNIPSPRLSSGHRDIDLWHPSASFGRVYDLIFLRAGAGVKPVRPGPASKSSSPRPEGRGCSWCARAIRTWTSPGATSFSDANTCRSWRTALRFLTRPGFLGLIPARLHTASAAEGIATVLTAGLLESIPPLVHALRIRSAQALREL